MNSKIEWCLNQHRSTNHMYDDYLPYEYHLRMVSKAANEFSHLLDKYIVLDIKMACWGHDLIEDTRVTYNDVKSQLGEKAADIIYAVTNEKGKNRKERANDKYYEGIRNTPGATFVKLCDRIANIQYSKMTKSRMFNLYKQENDNFISRLHINDNDPLIEMVNYIKNILNE